MAKSDRGLIFLRVSGAILRSLPGGSLEPSDSKGAIRLGIGTKNWEILQATKKPPWLKGKRVLTLGSTKNDDDDSDDDDSGSDTVDVCDEANFSISFELVDMLIVLDRSNSMGDDNLWVPMGSAISEVVNTMSEQINFGLMMFPDLSCQGLTNQCNHPTAPQVPFDAGNSVELITSGVGGGSSDQGVCGGTPIAMTLSSALNYLNSVDDDNARYVLLATDGAPNCNASLDGSTCTCTGTNCILNNENCLDDTRTYNAAAALKAAGYTVYVLGIGGSADWSSVMQQIATSGGGEYYSVTDTANFLDALQEITGTVVSCEFDIDWDSLEDNTSTDPDLVNFYCLIEEDEEPSLDNVLGYDEDCANGSGWDWLDEDTVVFCEEACQMLKDGECPYVTATFGCESIPVQ
jgi:hypothetical protein